MPKKITLKLKLDQHTVQYIRKACKFHKMTVDQFIVFALKKKIREENPDILQEDKFYLYTAKEERALRRLKKIKLSEDV